MTAATQARNTKFREGKKLGYPVAAATKIYAGTLVGIGTGTAYAGPMTAATTWKVAGVAAADADNSAGLAGDIDVEVLRGVFCFANGESITLASVGATAYANDNQTIYTTATGRSACGIIRYASGEGVWIEL